MTARVVRGGLASCRGNSACALFRVRQRPGHQIDTLADRLQRHAIPARFGDPGLNVEVGQQRAAITLRGSRIDRGAQSLRRQLREPEQGPRRDQARNRIGDLLHGFVAGARVARLRDGAILFRQHRRVLFAQAATDKISVGPISRGRVAFDVFESLASIDIQRRGAERTAHQFRACDKFRPAGGSQYAFRFRETALRQSRIALQVVLFEFLQRRMRLRLPFRRHRPGGTGAQQQREANDRDPHGSLISVDLRANGHLRLISSISPSTLRMLSSTSTRSAPRSVVASLTLVAAPLNSTAVTCAVARTASAFFRLSRASPRMAFNCATDFFASSITPPWPNILSSVFASTPSARAVTPLSEASNAFTPSTVSSTFLACSGLPVTPPSRPYSPAMRSVTDFRLTSVWLKFDSGRMISSMLCRTPLARAMTCGISCVASFAARGRSEPGGNCGSCILADTARIFAPPKNCFSSENKLLVRSQRASFTLMRTSMRTRPSSSSAMVETWPIGNPENMTGMPTTTPSASAASSVSAWVRSNIPRA